MSGLKYQLFGTERVDVAVTLSTCVQNVSTSNVNRFTDPPN